MPNGNGFPVRTSIPNVFRVQGKFTGGGAATSCTVTSGDWNRGIASLAYNSATGKYLMTFTDCGQQIVGWGISVSVLTGVDPVIGSIIEATYDATLKTVQVEFGATLIDLLTTQKVYVWVEFSKTPPP